MKMSETKLQTLVKKKNGEIENLNYVCQIYAYKETSSFESYTVSYKLFKQISN